MIRLTLLLAALSGPAAAYEYENAVPLTVALAPGSTVVTNTTVRLDGRAVTVSASLVNGTASAQRIGWFASTPQFSQLGEGEEHLDKSFADVRATFNGQPRKAAVEQRAYFMGRDITAAMAKAGLAPLPDLQADGKKLARVAVPGFQPQQWQGYAAYSWRASVPANASATVAVHYRALPQFAMTDVASPAFTQAVMQHCGDADAIRRHILGATGGQVLIERYDVPLPSVSMQEVQVDITQPAANWLHARPLVSLVCGLDHPGLQATVTGVVANANAGLSVLVVSALPEAGAATFGYRLGAIRVTEDPQQIVIHAQPPVQVDVLPGGKTWPWLALDDGGRIYAGGAVIDAQTGRVTQSDAALTLPAGADVTAEPDGYLLRQGRHACRLPRRQLHVPQDKTPVQVLKDANLMFAGSGQALLALATQFGADGKVANYRVQRIDVAHCKVSMEKQLGNPDLLVELGYSPRGGWWVTGSIEATLLHSPDGRNWRNIRLPDGLSSLASSYVVDRREIWLAGILPAEGGPSPYLLVYSGDGGRHWRNVMKNDPLLARIPAGWLEGQKRRVLP